MAKVTMLDIPIAGREMKESTDTPVALRRCTKHLGHCTVGCLLTRVLHYLHSKRKPLREGAYRRVFKSDHGLGVLGILHLEPRQYGLVWKDAEVCKGYFAISS